MKKRTIERTMFYNASPEILRRAKKLRSNMTEAEKILWEELRSRKLGTGFKVQHPIERFIVDFYCHQAKLVIEIDSKIHGFHEEYDQGRKTELEKNGIKVLRFSNEAVINNINVVIDEIKVNINVISSSNT